MEEAVDRLGERIGDAGRRLQVGEPGAARKRALLAHFGSAKAVSRAGLADLKAAPGISDALAETIYGFFHGEG